MTDKEYRAAKKRVLSFANKWFVAMGLGWFEVDYEWSRILDENAPNTAAKVHTQWQYRMATVTWFLPNLANLSDEKLESIVVHEFTHILINPLTLIDKEEDLSLQHEFATETIARAFEWVRKAGQNDKK